MALNVKKEFAGRKIRTPDMGSLVYGKIPPQAPELEGIVLGAIMLENCIEKVRAIIHSGDCFYTPANQKIYKAILELHNLGYPVDLPLVTDRLRKNDELEIVGGAYYLTELTMEVVSSANVENHARIVMEKYTARELIRISGEVIGLAYEDSTDVFDLKAHAELEMATAGGIVPGAKPVHASDVAAEVLGELHERRVAKIDLTGVPTGWAVLDRITSGWQKTDLIILAARPAVGKTAFLVSLMKNAALSSIKPVSVLLFSLEMSKKQLIQRMLSAIAGVPASLIFYHPKDLSPDELERLNEAHELLSKCRFFVEDSVNITPAVIKARAEEIKAKHGLDMIGLDYLQLANSTEKKSIREQEISSISRDLKKTAKELEVPVIALSQLNRLGDGVEPQLSHLRESGAIEQDADVVMFLYAPDPEQKDLVNLTIKKHRNGALEEIGFKFESYIQSFRPLQEVDLMPPIQNFAPPPNPRAGIKPPNYDNEPF